VNRIWTDDSGRYVIVLDETGKLIKTEYTKTAHSEGARRTYVPSSKAVLFKRPWAPAFTTARYLLENLHPPILTVTSYFTGYSFEALSGHNAMFILPNSFVAMLGRDVVENAAAKLMFVLLLMMPSIVLSIFLSRLVGKDAKRTGFGESARLYWIIGTLCFGLSAYITYRLTRPKDTLVTCRNCGKLRRPDMNLCHLCKSRWDVPELLPPAWRVLENGSKKQNNYLYLLIVRPDGLLCP